MPVFRATFRDTPRPGDRQLGFDVASDTGVSGNCLLTLDRSVFDGMNAPNGVLIEVTVTPAPVAAAPAKTTPAAKAATVPPA